jgi:hypothetical protein
VARSYSIVLTEAEHTVRAEDASRILTAIEEGRKTLDVGVEVYPGSPRVHPTTIVLSHVIEVSAVDDGTAYSEAVADAGDKVVGIWTKR